MKKKLIGYKIRIHKDVVAKMTSLLALLHLLQLIGEFEDSYSVTLMDAFRRAVVTDGNIPIYIAALIALGADKNFADFLQRSFMSFDDQCFILIPTQNLKFVIPGYRRKHCRYVSIRNLPNNLGLNVYSEHLVEYFWRVVYDGMFNGRIPVGAQLIDGAGRFCKHVFFSHNKSMWSNCCPICMCKVEDCQNDGHMNPRCGGEYPNVGRYMFQRIVSEMADECFWRFCFQYAKFSVSLMLNPIALSQVSFHLLDDQCKFMIPFLPSRYKPDRSRTVEMLFGILDRFQELQVGNQLVLVPKPCMLLLEPSSKMEFLTKGSMVHRLAGSLVGSQFKEAIIRRVLNSPNMKRLGLFRAQNRSFCNEILKVLRMYKAPEGLIAIFEAFL